MASSTSFMDASISSRFADSMKAQKSNFFFDSSFFASCSAHSGCSAMAFSSFSADFSFLPRPMNSLILSDLRIQLPKVKRAIWPKRL